MAKSEKYWYDAEAIKEPSVDPPGKKRGGSLDRFGPSESLISGEAHRGDKEYESNGKRNARSVWTIPTQPYRGAHFATFPEALIRPCILAGCPPDGWVLDPFCGSGTTLKVANDLGRNSVGIELSAEYVKLAEARVEKGIADRRAGKARKSK